MSRGWWWLLFFVTPGIGLYLIATLIGWLFFG